MVGAAADFETSSVITIIVAVAIIVVVSSMVDDGVDVGDHVRVDAADGPGGGEQGSRGWEGGTVADEVAVAGAVGAGEGDEDGFGVRAGSSELPHQVAVFFDMRGRAA